jgi:biotin synthase
MVLSNPNPSSKPPTRRIKTVTAVGLVAAWKGLNEGPMLDEVCDRIRELKAGGKTRPDASLGIIKKQEVADRLKEAGLECYGHNLESSRRFFPQTCTTHTFDDRLETIGYLKKAGIKICSGGIIGMGETRADRCDLAFELKAIGANVVPVNILNPIPGTPFEKNPPLPVLEILKTIACFRFILPRQEIMIAGGRTVNLRDAQSMIFMAGASALMVGNYLTTLNQPVEKDLQMLKDLGLDPNWDSHDFSDQEEAGCGCGKESCEMETLPLLLKLDCWLGLTQLLFRLQAAPQILFIKSNGRRILPEPGKFYPDLKQLLEALHKCKFQRPRTPAAFIASCA